MNRTVKTTYPLSYGQQAMWLINQMAPESVAYNIFITVKINSYLNIATVIRVWEKICEYHPILRTTYTIHEGKPVQQINEQQKFPIEVIDAFNWSEDDLKEKIFAETDRPFNLEKDSVLRGNLFTCSAKEHILLLTMHHIAGDMWSFDLLLREFQSLYATEIEQASLEQKEAAEDYLTNNKSYVEFVHWQSEMLSGSRGEKLWQYWQEQLAGELPILNLLADKPRPIVQTYQGAAHISKLDEQLIQKLKNLALASGTSLYKLLLAAFYLLIYRYTAQKDILIVSPMRGRWGGDFQGIVGYFVNLIVLRTSVGENATFTEFLAQVSNTVKEAQNHQDYPFSLLAEQLEQQRDPSRSPLCQVGFTWQAQRWCEPTENSLHSQEQVLEMEPYLLGHQRGADLDLNLMVMEALGVFQLCWQYNTDLFEASTITRMAGHFVTLLEGIVANPKEQISQLSLLTEHEQQQLLIEWNDTQAEYPQDKCIHQLFEEQVQRTPNAVAVVFEDQQLTYGELNCRANQLAHYLRSLGVSADVLVGICVERSLEMVIGLLGILKAGGAYVPLDPEYPQDRLNFILEDTQVSVLLTQQPLKDKLPKHQAKQVFLDEVWAEIVQNNQDNPTNGVRAFHLANVIYTSGSTGKPKGVMVEHSGLCNLAQAQIQTFGLHSDSRILQFASFSFDASISEVLMAFGSGATLYLGTKDSLMPGTPLIQRLRNCCITHITLPPSALAVLPIEELSALQTIIVAGEACSVELMRQWSAGRNFFNAYGPTEASVCATVAKCTPDDKKVSIGRPISSTQIYILDEYLQLVPVGVPGELHIGGVGLARGYLNRPELTLEKFISNPFNKSKAPKFRSAASADLTSLKSHSSKLYKTGDLARYLPSGNIEYLGRIDNQVKIRGFRIELGEIEASLSQHGDVQASCVIAREDIPGNKRLVAYIVPHPEVTPTVSELRSFLQEKLPDYMVPSAFIILESLPLTPNGKVDRRALPAPESRTGIEVSLVAPRTRVEEILAQIWGQVLRVEQVGIHDNFFELGGDSILSIQIITRAKQAGLELSVKQLFANKTIAQLATVAGTTKALQIEQGLVSGTLPLTPIQHWFFEQNLPQKHHFNQSFLLSVPSNLKPEILEQVWQQLLLHHDALRLRFTQTESGWQQIHSDMTQSIAIKCFDLSTISESEQKAAIEATATSLQASLNLSENLVQVALFRLGIDKRARLLIVIHHLVVDGVSWRILLEDLQTAYQQLSQGKAIQLPAKTTSFKEWAQHLTDYAVGNRLKSELAYWLSESRSKVSPIPVDYAEEVNTAASGSTISVSLNSAQTLSLLQDVPKAYKTQINDVLLTALVLVLSKWTNSKSVLFNLEGHGREDIVEGVDLSRTIGWFTTIFPVLVELEVTDNLGNVLKSVKEQLRAIPNKGIGYGLWRYLNVEPEISAQLQTIPLAEISFNYLGQFTQVLNKSSLMQIASEKSGNSQSLQGQRPYLLDINAIIINEQLQIDWAYSTNVHQHQTIENIAQEFVKTLREIIAHCLSPLNGGYTPTDFPLVKLNQLELDGVLAKLALKPEQQSYRQNVEDIYPLSPMQEGMLFESLYAPSEGVYFEQIICTFTGNLNVEAFSQAWQQVVSRHSIFRTAFLWESSRQPLQVVYRHVFVQVVTLDWRELSTLEQQQQLETFLSCERQKGFQLSQAPLMHLHLIQLSGDTYQFVWCHHHLLLDGWSLPLVFKDLLDFYQAISLFESLQLQPTISYRNYIAWLQQQDKDIAAEFWRQKLISFSAPTPMTVDKPLSNREEHSGYGEQEIQLTVSATAAVASFARQHQLTMNNLVQATWGLLLSRYSGETDVVFGATVSGRPPGLVGVESMVGLFINTLPVRVQISEKTELLLLLKDLQAQQVESEQFSYSSLVEIQGLSDVPRATSLFDSIVVFENYPVDTAVLQGNGCFSISNFGIIEQTNYPLTVLALPGEQLLLKVSYDTSRFDHETISRMLGHFVTILEAIVANPQQRISQLPLLTESEQHQLLVEWNDTECEYPKDKCIHQLFESQVEKTPHTVAVVFENQQLTYLELNQRANQLAHHLQTLGVGPEVLVGICVERSIEMVVGLLGILKAGGAYVPLDPNYPQERLSYMLADSGVEVLLTQKSLLESLPSHSARLVCLDTDWEAIEQHNKENLDAEVSSGNLAYVIYTSGSTGVPKGVMNTQRAIHNRLLWMQQSYQLSSSDRVVQKTPFSFDVSVWEFFWPLLTGASIVVALPEGHKDSTYLVNLISQQQITTIHFVPSMLQVFLLEPNSGNCSCLKRVFCSGEALSFEVTQRFFSKLECELHNLYGPTEAAIDVTFWQCLPQENLHIVPIGRPISNTQIYVLDQHLQPVPIGVPGELYIGGDGLAVGYLNRPELTREKFIPNPFCDSKSERLYKTGDLARHRADGNIEYLGRMDNQVKIRGFRIELGEIEASLSQHGDVQASCVIAREDIPGNKRLVAYIVPHPEVTPTVSELRSFLQEKLPDYMVPSAFIILESLPLTPNGKVDRRALPAPESRTGIEVSLVAPRTRVEEILAQIWGQVLRVEQVGIHDNFFELGGDSILSIQIITRAKQAGLELSVKQLFANKTIAQLATVAGTTKALQIEQGLVSGTLPLTPIQHWFFEQNLPQKHHFNQSFLLSVPSNLKPEILEQVWQQLLLHHDALRLRFTQTESGWQQIHSDMTQSIAIKCFDLSTISESEQKAAIEATATSLQASLNLSENLVQVALFRLGIDKRARLLIVIHHLVVDGVSWRILLEDLQTAYQQLSQGKAIQLPAKTTSFKEWAQHLTDYAVGNRLKSELAYWLSESRSKVSPIPVDYAEGVNTAASGSTISVSLNSAQTLSLLQDVPKAYKTQINDVLLTALVLVLSKWTNSKSVLFNLEGHGREDIVEGVDLSRTIGWFTTIFPVLVELEVTDNLGNVLKSVKEQLRAIPNKGIGYGLWRYLNVEPEISAQLQTIPLAEISFNYLGQFTQVLNKSSLMQIASEKSGNSQSLQGQRPYLLDINAIIINEQLQIDWAYSTNVHQHQTIENIAQEFVKTLREIIAHCLSPLNGGYTPTDFPLVKLNQLELDGVLAKLALKPEQQSYRQNVEDIYPLSPMQEGMLFESLYAPSEGVYFEQIICTFTGNLNVEAFSQAWQQVVSRHSIFRTAFLWESSRQPLQVVYRHVFVQVVTLDWRELSTLEQQQQLETFLSCERQKGFQLSQAPLMHLHLIQLSGDTYQFVWCHHHLLLDGWSLPLVFKDLLDFYQAISLFESLQLQPTISYRNYIAWLQQQDKDIAAEFWRQKLISFSAPTPMTVDKPLSNREEHSGYGEQEIQLTVSATAAVASFARQHQLTMNNLVQATWGLLLSRYSGETDVVFGATVSGRPPGLVGVESMVGLFINTLPVRVQISEKTELLLLLKDLQAQQVESEQFSYSSLVEIQGLSDVPRATSLFDSIVVFENYPVDTAVLQGNGCFAIANIRAIEPTNYPLTVIAVPRKQLLLKVMYDTSRFEDGTISRMLGHFVTILEAIVANPQQRISQLPMLTEPEQQQLLVEWNNTQANYPQDKCIHQLFEEQVARTPDAVAVVFENQQLTYTQLNSRANQLAHYLRSLGVSADVLVGLCVERSLLMVVGLLGILKAGGAYVPIDPEYPTDRLTFMLEDAQVKVLLTQQQLVERLPEHKAHQVCLDTNWQLISQLSQDNLISAVVGNNLGYVIYTSGSTGQPKGVAMNQLGLCNLLLWQRQNTTISSGAKTLQFAPISFDVSFQEMFSTWCSGGTLLLIGEELRREPSCLLGLLQEQAVERLFVPFVALQQLAEVAVDRESVTSNLRQIITAGEQLQITPAISHWLSKLTDCTLHNHYGPSESHVVTTFTLTNSVNSWSLLPPIGRPIANTQIYILDKDLQPVPVGVPGELHIGGASLARGYFNRPELTLEKFISNPFSTYPSSRLYKTGDLARYLSDGNIEYLGRIDNQVKIRGFRIELGEIEAVLSQYPHVQASCVIVREDTTGDKRLVAYIVPHPQVTPTVSELRQFLKAKLPEYMVPNAIVILESLPLTPNGKVDRRALKAPDSHSEYSEKYVAPRNPIEEILSLIWAQVLKVELVGIYDNFFELGGHSLLATQLVSRVRTSLKVELPLRSLFAAPTVAELGQNIQWLQQQDLELASPPILPRVRNAELPLSFGQQRLWFLDQFDPNSALYNIPIALRLVGTLNQAALEQSLEEIIHRHEALRTNFITVDGQPTQIIQTPTNWTLSIVELQHLPTSEQEIASKLLAQQQAIQPFDISSSALLRATLVVLSETEHILNVCMHHIVSDGWSMGVFVQELAALYNAYSQSQPSTLTPLPIQYADFALWQRQWLQGDVLESQLSYWQKQLADAPALLLLPTDRPRPAVQTYNGAHQEFPLSLSLTQRLAQLSQDQGCTLFMTLLAAFDTLLYRYTGQEDILVGSPIANRNRSEIEGLIGFFVNTLVMRTDLSENPSFQELLTRVRSMALGAYAHQDLPFEMLVEVLQPERDLSHTPLIQVMFVLQNAPISEVELTGLNVSPLKLESATAKFDLTLAIQNTATGLVGVWEYNTDLFDAPTIERMAGHFRTLLEAIEANPQERISQLPLLTASESQQLLVEWNDTRVDYPQDKCIHQLFEEQVERTPDAVAVVFQNQQLTYHQLNDRANQLAHYLQSLGVGSDVLVGICVERSLSMVVGLLGILKAGGAYVPLDPEYPTSRLTFMLEDTQLSVLLTQEKLVASFPQHQARVVCLDTDWQSRSGANQDNLNSTANPENLSYVIYTSGSTGTPKGVAVTHQAVNRLVKNTNYIQLTPDDRVAQAANIAFDAATFEIWGALLNGAKLVIITKSVLLSPQEFAVNIRESEVSVLFLTTALFNQLASFVPQAFSSLRYLLFGGEAVDPRWVLEVLDKGAPEQLLHVYGPTENTTFSSWYLVEELATTATTIPIGRAISNTQIYLLDQNLQPVPIGIPGELYLGGTGLALCYFNRPELTQEKFITNPFSTYLGSRLYKTGDLGRYLPDGNIEYLGRIDNQVKIRGFRIELGEIEAVLSQHGDVQASCIIAHEDTPGEKWLVAYIVPQPGQIPTISELRQFLKTKLPEYMIPNAIVILESLPLTSNGKVDRRALKSLFLAQEHSEKYVAPRNPIEEILALIWANVLNVKQVGIDDNFFELGGHSLLATQLISRVRTSLKVELSLRSLFTAPTIAELSQNIQLLQQRDIELTAPPILPRAENAEIPLSFAQNRLWFLDQLQPNSAFYNIPIVLRIVGTLHQAALEQSLQEIIHRHEALRTNFVTVDGQPTQIIQTATNWTVSVVDLKHLSISEQEVASKLLAQQQAIQPFDLARVALVRVTLVVLSETEHILNVCMHHIVSDGWSMGVFVQELAALYHAYSQSQPSPLAPLLIQYADFAIWQREWLQGDVLQSQLSYWQKQLADAPALLLLPTDRPRPAVQTYNGAHQKFALSLSLTQRLAQLSQDQGCTLFMTLLAAFDTLLYRYTGQEDILVGSPIANRNHSEIEGLIGFFVNTLVLRTDVSGDPSFNELLTRVRSMALSAYAHQDLPFEMLVEALQPQRDLSHTPFFQVMFVLQNAPMSQVELTGLTVSSLPIESLRAKFALTLSMENTATGLVGVWEYNTDLFDSSTIERMTGHFMTMLEAILANPEERISQLPLLTEVEQHQLLINWNNTQVDYSQSKCIHQLFSEQVERTPDEIAVVFVDEQSAASGRVNQQLTYSQLNNRANQLAHYLRSLGVSADVLVGICVERSLDMLVGLLGILKAGGAYVPLDPEYPQERLSFMLEDAQVQVLLTQQHLVEKLPEHQARVVYIDSDWEKIAQKSESNPLNCTTPSTRAYVIYTSGSTGQPKGVLVNHNNVVRLFAATEPWYQFNSQDVWTLFHSYAFDFSVWEIWGALLYGGRLVVVPYLVTRSPESFYELLCQEKVTILNQTPSAFRQLIQAEQSIATVGDLKLRLVIFGGEALEVRSLQPWFDRHGHQQPQLVNMYGITETTVHVTYRPLSIADVNGTASVIGRPIPDLQVYLLDQHLQPVPIGVPGEMYIGGAGVTGGYLNRPELTAQRFISNFFNDNSSQLLYKSGDLARYLPNGELEYLGRIDQQVKIRGFRIELGEIEALLAQNPAIRESVVVVRSDDLSDKRLVAYVVPYVEKSLTTAELRRFLKENLPEYMVPNAIVILESLPLTANGKIDRRALPAPDSHHDLKDKYVAPRTPIEEMLAQIWTQILKVEKVGIHDNFFTLGGHSLLATQLISRIRTSFKVELPLRSLFAEATVAELALSIQQLQQQNIELKVPPILPRKKNAK